MGVIQRKVGPYVAATLLSPKVERTVLAAAELRRKLGRRSHRVSYFHQADDPYSHLAAQLLSRLRENYQVEIDIHLVSAPDDAAAPERALLVAYSRKDAADVAPHYGLEFTDGGRQPGPHIVGRANRILASALSSSWAGELMGEVGRARGTHDEEALAALASAHGQTSGLEAEAVVADGTKLRAQLGHYLGATFYYGGRWYWGPDRLHYLENRLEALGLRRSGPGLLVEPPTVEAGPGSGQGFVLEYFASLRSPYTAIVADRVFGLAQRTGLALDIRPVLPMVMRGLPVPRAKRMYIMRDAKREADRFGIPFGRISDPVGRPVERALAVYPLALELGRQVDYLHSYFELVWSRGVDAGADAGLRRIVEGAGMSWEEARRRLTRDEWRTDAEDNRSVMFEMGLWGVPSFRLSGPEGQPPLCTWGQDRLWLLENEITRRAALADTAGSRA